MGLKDDPGYRDTHYKFAASQTAQKISRQEKIQQNSIRESDVPLSP